MSLFSPGPQTYLGIDFRSNSVKVVELHNDNGRPRLITYGYVDTAIEQPKLTDDKADYQRLAKVVRQVCRQAQTTTTGAVSALPMHVVFGSILSLPPLEKKELEAAVKREAQKIAPMSLEEMVLDWKVLEDGRATVAMAVSTQSPDSAGENGEPARKKFLAINPEKKKAHLNVLLTAAPKNLVKHYITLFKDAKLNLLTLDTESFALIRSLVGNDKSALMIVDIGGAVTNITVVVEGVPIWNRSIRVGGIDVTKAIAQRLKVSLEQAEQFKYDLSVSESNQAAAAIPELVTTTLTPIVDELKYSLSIYKQQGRKPIEKIILTGGSSLLLDLPSYLASQINLKVYRGNPWARIIVPAELQPVLDEIGARFAVALGLAMRYIQ